MTDLAVTALRGLIDDVAALGTSLTSAEWDAPSACAGWAVRDVYAHMAWVHHALGDPASEPWPALVEPEPENEEPVARRREWKASEVLDEYLDYAPRATEWLAGEQHRDEATSFGALGTHPAHFIADCIAFDHLLHLHEDLLAPFGPLVRERPAVDETRLIPAVGWITAGLSRQANAAQIRRQLSAPLALRLDGAGGGTWLLEPGSSGVGGAIDGRRVEPAEAEHAATTVTSTTEMFVSWATKRRDWRRCGVRITGDDALAAGVLDAVHVV